MALGWWLVAVLCAVTVVGLPWARSCWVIGRFSLWPFGTEAINRRDLKGRADLGTGPVGILQCDLVRCGGLVAGSGSPQQRSRPASSASLAFPSASSTSNWLCRPCTGRNDGYSTQSTLSRRLLSRSFRMTLLTVAALLLGMLWLTQTLVRRGMDDGSAGSED